MGNDHHITPQSTYYKVFGTLICFTVITVVASLPQFDAGSWNTFIAMVIATVKASLVVWWFMHQNHENKLNRLIFISGFIFLLIFFGFSMIDIATRDHLIDLQFGNTL